MTSVSMVQECRSLSGLFERDAPGRKARAEIDLLPTSTSVPWKTTWEVRQKVVGVRAPPRASSLFENYASAFALYAERKKQLTSRGYEQTDGDEQRGVIKASALDGTAPWHVAVSPDVAIDRASRPGTWVLPISHNAVEITLHRHSALALAEVYVEERAQQHALFIQTSNAAVRAAAEQVPPCSRVQGYWDAERSAFQAVDLHLWRNQNLIHLPFATRRQILERHCATTAGTWEMATIISGNGARRTLEWGLSRVDLDPADVATQGSMALDMVSCQQTNLGRHRLWINRAAAERLGR